ncbi:MAG: hypothetical protein MUF54_08215 [Polyangiaceae bacterium]|jgi:hypothetical protein|nr:hypothetical protein [Polyangiaceae bacterium]
MADCGLGITCSVCDRGMHIIVDDDRWRIGCAYALRDGLCQNYIRLTLLEASALRRSRMSPETALKIWRKRTKR